MQILTFLWRFANVFSEKIYFQEKDTVLVGMVPANSRKSSQKKSFLSNYISQ